MTRALFVVLSLVMVAPLRAQEPPQEKPKPSAETVVTPRETGQALNIRVDITISEQTGTAPATAKSVSILCADNNAGRIRSYNPIGGARAGELNVDVRPRLMQGSRVQVAMTVEYRPASQESAAPGAAPSPLPGLSESLTVILEDGKPLLVSQSADPNTDRKVKLEVKATVVR